MRPPMREGNADFEGGDGFPPTMGGERPDFGQRPGNGNVSKEEMMAAQKKKEQSMKKILNPEQYEKGYQTLQGLYAIGSGGLFGRGLGESIQKLGFVPEAQNDMIFSIICEDGSFYSFNAKYTKEPEMLNIEMKDFLERCLNREHGFNTPENAWKELALTEGIRMQ